MTQRKKVLIIGMDGFTWDIGRDLMAEGVMPNLARLVEQGCHGILRSVIPSETAPAWSSFQTGCRPGKTGIFTFYRYDPVQKRLRFNSYTDIAVPTLWELASRVGKKVIAVNFPMTSPPPKINGVVIPGLLCPGLSADTVYPSEVYEKYIACEPDYKIVDARPVDSVEEFIDRHIRIEQARMRVGMRLMAEKEWDLFCYEMQSTDHVQHHFWSALDRTVPNFREENRREVSRFYRCCDEILGRLIESAGPEVLTLLVSDHGFARLDTFFKMNVWLRQHGYLKLSRSAQRQETKNKLKRKIPILRYLARGYGRLKKTWESADQDPSQELLNSLQNTIDISHSSAFSVGAMAGLVYLNADRSLQDGLIREITTRLLSEYGPSAATAVIEKIYMGKELFAVEPSEGMPDLVVQFVEGVFAHVLPTGEEAVAKPDYTDTQKGFMQLLGTHSQRGVFLAQGAGVKAGGQHDGEIVDIVPTVLGYLGIPVPRHMDGKVLDDVFRQHLEISYTDAAGGGGKESNYSAEEESEIQKRLSDLGYL